MTATLPRTGTDTDSSPPPERDAVVARWHALRRMIGAIAAGLAAFSGVLLMWPVMAVVVLLAGGIALDATLALRSGRTHVVATLVADITFTSIALVLADVPPPAIGVVVAYYVLVAAVVGEDGSLIPVGGYAVVTAALAGFGGASLDTAGGSLERSLASGIIVVSVFAVATVAMLREFSVVRDRGRATVGRRIELADAVSRASHALVAEDDARSLSSALDAVREAMGVSVVFVERNMLDAESGLVAVVVARSVDRDVAHPSVDMRNRVPWSVMPGARAHLEGGAPFFYRVEEARGTVADRGGDGGLQVEVNLPIRLGDDWVGVIGAADADAERVWRTDDLALLRTMAGLTSAHWQRAENARARDSLIGSLDGRLRYEEAIARASQALLGEHASDLEPALNAVGAAAGLDEVLITHAIADDGGAPAAVVVHGWTAPGHVAMYPVDRRWSYATQPEVQRAIQRGEMARRIDEGRSSELIAGLEVEGAWYGTVAFVKADDRHSWSRRDEGFLRTFADMIAVFHERERSRIRLEESLDSKDQLIATVSHELRSPLTVVSGLAEELRAGGDTFDADEREQLLGVIQDESAEMADLIEDLLVAARSEDGSLPVFPERVDLSLLSRGVVDHLAVPESHTVVVEDVPSVAFGDPVRIRQVIRNLLTNAFRYGGTDVELTFGRSEHHAWVDVHDDGVGIEEGDRTTIFEPYGRARTGKRVTASVGLGLALARRLARLMDGDLELLDGPRCTFRLTVPLPEGVEAGSAPERVPSGDGTSR